MGEMTLSSKPNRNDAAANTVQVMIRKVLTALPSGLMSTTCSWWYTPSSESTLDFSKAMTFWSDSLDMVAMCNGGPSSGVSTVRGVGG